MGCGGEREREREREIEREDEIRLLLSTFHSLGSLIM